MPSSVKSLFLHVNGKCVNNHSFRPILAVVRDQGLQGVLPLLGIDHPREGIPADEEREEQEYRGGNEGTGCRKEIKEEKFR
jgi:hypothetical protein